MDRLSKRQRSALMSKIRGKDTQPEMAVRRFVWRAGFRYRLYVRGLPGTPDLVFRPMKNLIFVHGCFWHGHKCRGEKLPKTHTKFWEAKISRNRERDVATVRKLRRIGWKCLTVWECEVKRPGALDKILFFLEQ